MTHSTKAMTNILRDPLIRQVMRADGVSLTEFAQLLIDASKTTSRSLISRSIPLPERKKP